MHSRNTRDFRSCPHCGAELTAGESCNCQQRLPRDGLRATCPYFHHRGNYRRVAYIVCKVGGERVYIKTPFGSSEERNQAYMCHCCLGESCPIAQREAERYEGRDAH